ncbi:GAP family protein [Mycolicibacterium confluentis]|uniref:GAP family protein n=1 Tax=Mycolicibacterium confluentis TaxID=28047 RepID=UPI001F415706|nr:GAP family protein [Mycolicibacterium confluentis]
MLALVLTINPVRLGLILLVLSRPRPMQNLLAYWAGTLLAGLVFLLFPLIVLHLTNVSPTFANGLVDSAPSPLFQRTMIGFGAFLVLVAILMVMRGTTATTPSDDAPVSGGRHRRETGTATRTLDPATLPVISRLVRPATEEAVEDDSWVRRLLRQARQAWRTGSPWISFVIGLMVMPADGVLLALALIVASGTAVGVQLAAGAAFVIGVLAVEEIILISNRAFPERTESALQRLHDWALAYHRRFMAAILAVVGASLVFQGMGGL